MVVLPVHNGVSPTGYTASCHADHCLAIVHASRHIEVADTDHSSADANGE